MPNAIRLQKAMKMYSCYNQEPTNKNENTISTKTQQRKKTESLPLPVSPRTRWALHLFSTQHAQEHYFNLEVKKTVADKLSWTSDEACQMYPYKMWSDAALLKQFKLNHTAIDSYQSFIYRGDFVSSSGESSSKRHRIEAFLQFVYILFCL